MAQDGVPSVSGRHLGMTSFEDSEIRSSKMATGSGRATILRHRHNRDRKRYPILLAAKSALRQILYVFSTGTFVTYHFVNASCNLCILCIYQKILCLYMRHTECDNRGYVPLYASQVTYRDWAAATYSKWPPPCPCGLIQDKEHLLVHYTMTQHLRNDPKIKLLSLKSCIQIAAMISEQSMRSLCAPSKLIEMKCGLLYFTSGVLTGVTAMADICTEGPLGDQRCYQWV